jgi:hypothetical protein
MLGFYEYLSVRLGDFLVIDCFQNLESIGINGSATEYSIYTLPSSAHPSEVPYNCILNPKVYQTTSINMGKKRVLISYGVDVDAVAGWLGSYHGEDSVNDISRGELD